MLKNVTVVIPAKNEEAGLSILLPELMSLLPPENILVVNDASTDDTESVCETHGVNITSHPYSMGNGAAIKTGVRNANGEVIVCMDADGQHRPEDIPRLLEKLSEGYDMVVGARGNDSQASAARGFGNRIYNRLAGYMTEQNVEDLTSGFRAVRASKFREFLHLLPNKFSYPTTITMAFFRAGYPVAYVPIVAPPRLGSSHLSILRDGMRFFLIIFKVGTLYSPLKIFTPVSLVFASLGLFYYMFTYISDGRFTNMGLLLFSTSVVIFFMGLLSEQITSMIYKSDS